MAPLPLLGPDDSQNRSAPSDLVGIARLAALGESISEGHLVEYFSLQTRSILNRCTSKRMPFTWTINPYRGCEFACKYCYARYTHEFMELRDGIDFERKIYVKQNASAREVKVVGIDDAGIGAQLRRDLKKVKAGEDIAIGTATDPYQPAERRFLVTRSILEELARHEGLEIGIVTKSNLVLRDADLLQTIARRNRLGVNVTVTTTDTALARILEPRAPRPDLRLDAVKQLMAAGISTGVLCAPVLPGITDTSQNLEGVVRAAAEAGARYVHANPLFLKPCSANVFLPFLEKEFPQLVEQYRRRYSDGAFVSTAYRKRISALMSVLKKKHGMDRAGRRDISALHRLEPKAADTVTQLALFS
ncbi:MAG: radical SAM protein [Candidatus Korobacteraceae bacterium]